MSSNVGKNPLIQAASEKFGNVDKFQENDVVLVNTEGLGSINGRSVMFVCAPIAWTINNKRELMTDERLATCYKKIFDEFDKSNGKAISIPAFSTGAGGVTKEQSARIALQETDKYLNSHNRAKKNDDLEIEFDCFDEAVGEEYAKQYNENYLNKNNSFGDLVSFRKGKETADIGVSKKDIIVCPIREKLNLGESGPIAKTICGLAAQAKVAPPEKDKKGAQAGVGSSEKDKKVTQEKDKKDARADGQIIEKDGQSKNTKTINDAAGQLNLIPSQDGGCSAELLKTFLKNWEDKFKEYPLFIGKFQEKIDRNENLTANEFSELRKIIWGNIVHLEKLYEGEGHKGKLDEQRAGQIFENRYEGMELRDLREDETKFGKFIDEVPKLGPDGTLIDSDKKEYVDSDKKELDSKQKGSVKPDIKPGNKPTPYDNIGDEQL